MMTIKQAKVMCRELYGISLQHKDGEFRVAYYGPNFTTEASAYYTSDLQDAIETAAAMAIERNRATWQDVDLETCYGSTVRLSRSIRVF